MSKNEEMVDGIVTGYGSFLPILLWRNRCSMRASLQHTSGPRTVTMIVTNIPTLTPSTTASVKLLGSTWKMVLTKVSDLWSLSVDIWMAWASLEHCR